MKNSSQLVIAGVDEVGRGPLVGPVVAAAVILDPLKPINGLNDSKKLSVKRRIELDLKIRECSRAWSIGSASPEEIDKLNILWASMLAMKRAVESLSIVPEKVLVDGNRCPDLTIPAEAIIKGDGKIDCISAASIVAKQARDAMMLEMHQQHPHYGFDRNSGYPTKQHLQALDEHGVIAAEHRKSFAPVRKALLSAVSNRNKSDV